VSNAPIAAKLPGQYRVKPPVGPPRLVDIVLDDSRYISDADIRIDSSWGVWLNPDAMVSASQNEMTPVKINRIQTGGYTVELSYAQAALNKVWVGSMTDSFADQEFVPASGVI
jgi:hypothetical protein